MPNARVAPLRISALGAAAGLLVSTFFALATPSPALAAADTDVVPFLHTEAGIGFRGEASQRQYYQGARLGARNEIRNLVDVNARFGAWTGLEIYLHTAYDAWDRVKYQDINFNGTPPTPNDQVERRKGLTDVWLGAKYAVLADSRGTGDVSTWTVETAVKIPGSYKIYPSTSPTAAESGAGTPGYEWLLKTAFSRRVRFVDPYVEFFYLNRGAGASSAEGVSSFKLADEWGTFFGTEIVGFEQRADNLKFAGDIGVGWRWVNDGESPVNRFTYGDKRTAGDPAITGSIVKEQGYVRYDGRVGFFYQLQKHARASGHLTIGLPGEHFLEKYPGSFTEPGTNNYGKIRNKAENIFGYEFSMSAIF